MCSSFIDVGVRGERDFQELLTRSQREPPKRYSSSNGSWGGRKAIG
jgi:hypothetical protein